MPRVFKENPKIYTFVLEDDVIHACRGERGHKSFQDFIRSSHLNGCLYPEKGSLALDLEREDGSMMLLTQSKMHSSGSGVYEELTGFFYSGAATIERNREWVGDGPEDFPSSDWREVTLTEFMGFFDHRMVGEGRLL